VSSSSPWFGRFLEWLRRFFPWVGNTKAPVAYEHPDIVWIRILYLMGQLQAESAKQVQLLTEIDKILRQLHGLPGPAVSSFLIFSATHQTKENEHAIDSTQ
jgi:hypothetical protein